MQKSATFHPSFFLLLALCAVFGSSLAQPLPLGTWRQFQRYNNANSLAVSTEDAFISTGHAILKYDKSDGAISKIDRVYGLSDMDISGLAFDTATQNLLIFYDNSNIDLYDKDGHIYNFAEIKNKVISGDKRIYRACFDNHLAYIATGFGVQLFDMDRLEFKETYVLGSGGTSIPVRDVSMLGNKVYACTDEGLKYIDKDHPGILSYLNWQTLPGGAGMPVGLPKKAEQFGNKLFVAFEDSLWSYDGSSWQFVFYHPSMSITGINHNTQALILSEESDTSTTSRLVKIDAGGSISFINNSELSRTVGVYEESNGLIWLGDEYNGLQKLQGDVVTPLSINGPQSNAAFHTAFRNNEVYVASGAYNSLFAFTYNFSGFYINRFNWWQNYNAFNYPQLTGFGDIISCTANPYNDKVYFCSYQNGLIVYNKDTITTYNKDNSILSAANGDPSRTEVTDAAVDQNGNVWLTNINCNKPLVAITPDGQWYSFSAIPGVSSFKNLMIDSYGQKWMAVKGAGIVVYSEGNNLSNSGDDVYRQLTTSTGNGGLPDLNVNSIVEDKDGDVWAGTNQGLVRFSCVSGILTSNNFCDCERPIVNRNGFNGYLFSTQYVKALAVDGGNRKWVGTTNGVWLISADGKDELAHFDVSNSPLPSNDIYHIGINPNNGEVFFSTGGGLISYMGEATTGGEKFDSVTVYPNPVRPEYTGPIAIKGLVDDSYFKITDSQGNLIYQGRAYGGQAIWNGYNYNGQHGKTGMYLVLALSPDGKEHCVAKIVMLN